MQSQDSTPKPTELAITLAALSHRYGSPSGDWVYASQIAANLQALGFDVHGSRLGNTLKRMCEVDAPWLERRLSYGSYEYRVAPGGWCDIENKMPRVRVLRASGGA